MFNKSIRYFLLAILTLIITAQSPIMSVHASDDTIENDSNLEEKKWRTQSIGAYKGPHLGFIKFDNGNIEGISTCNSYSGVYSLKKNQTIEIYRIGVTQLKCDIDNKMQLETEFVKGLEHTKSYKIEGNSLILYKTDKAELARFIVR